MKQTIVTDAPITGWDCTEEDGLFVCTPSDDYIRHRAYFRWVTSSPADSTPFAYWITAEADFIAARGNDLSPLD